MASPTPIDPEKLLNAARELAGHGVGRPSQTKLRRSISMSYYALFHALTRQAAEHLIPDGKPEQQLRLARTFGHRDIKRACAWVSGRQRDVPQHVRAIVDPLRNTTIDSVAASFIDLQQARHGADYDHLMAYSKATVLAHISDASAAIKALEKAPARRRAMLFALVAISAHPA
jgi:uncharacterized protein (UPF0332 family)